VAKRRKQAAARGSTDLLLIKEAAEILGVSEMTLRRWDKAGKFKARRHPINNFRVYLRGAVLRLRRQIETGRAA
jgi:DNA-binding transcriptional MerR regulator